MKRMVNYIRKAIELADVIAPWDFYQNNEDCIPCSTVELDALAAQLVRQVDALDTPDTVEITHNKVWVGYRSKSSETWRYWKGPDRTMNTIKAIVESEVLE